MKRGMTIQISGGAHHHRASVFILNVKWTMRSRSTTISALVTMAVITRSATQSYGLVPLLMKSSCSFLGNRPLYTKNDRSMDEEPLPPVSSLLGSVIGRARRTLSIKQDIISTYSAADDNISLENDFVPRLSSSLRGEKPSNTDELPLQESVTDLLRSVVARGQSTLSDDRVEQPVSTNHTGQPRMSQEELDGFLESAIGRAQSTVSEKAREWGGIPSTETDDAEGPSPADSTASSSSSSKEAVQDLLRFSIGKARARVRHPKAIPLPKPSEKLTNRSFSSSIAYRDNPAITNTALAHSLWSSVLRPTIDSAVDATCGNGYDSLVIAKMLFPPSQTTQHDTASDDEIKSQLLCIDIQQQACDNTTRLLSDEWGSQNHHLMDHHVQVLRTSHAPLPRPNDSSSVGLVVYNLGWLPNSAKEYITTMESTLSSLVDAFLLVRVGGMVSVVTYPKSNPSEDIAVRALLESMALLSSNVLSWRENLDQTVVVGSNDVDEETRKDIKRLVTEAMERVTERGDSYQTWRVSEHTRLGMDRAPILFTAMRIK